MSVINSSFSDFFTGAGLVLNNAQEQPDIAAALDAMGYDAATILRLTACTTRRSKNMANNTPPLRHL